jgi:hypothetical protein
MKYVLMLFLLTGCADVVEYLELGCIIMQTDKGADIKCGRTIASISNGKDGRHGRDGRDGKDGKNGLTAVCSPEAIYNWRIKNQGLVGALTQGNELMNKKFCNGGE